MLPEQGRFWQALRLSGYAYTPHIGGALDPTRDRHKAFKNKSSLHPLAVSYYTSSALHRHTFCSWLAMERVNIKEIQELSGHKTITMLSRYAHLSADHKLAVIDRISSRG